jgi:hypothetical protein
VVLICWSNIELIICSGYLAVLAIDDFLLICRLLLFKEACLALLRDSNTPLLNYFAIDYSYDIPSIETCLFFYSASNFFNYSSY